MQMAEKGPSIAMLWHHNSRMSGTQFGRPQSESVFSALSAIHYASMWNLQVPWFQWLRSNYWPTSHMCNILFLARDISHEQFVVCFTQHSATGRYVDSWYCRTDNFAKRLWAACLLKPETSVPHLSDSSVQSVAAVLCQGLELWPKLFLASKGIVETKQSTCTNS